MWQIGQAIHEKKCIEIGYERTKDKKVVKRKVEPQAILFSEFYFYLAANIEGIDKEKAFDVANDAFPTIYRIDRIQELQVLDEHFNIRIKTGSRKGSIANEYSSCMAENYSVRSSGIREPVWKQY